MIPAKPAIKRPAPNVGEVRRRIPAAGFQRDGERRCAPGQYAGRRRVSSINDRPTACSTCSACRAGNHLAVLDAFHDATSRCSMLPYLVHGGNRSAGDRPAASRCHPQAGLDNAARLHISGFVRADRVREPDPAPRAEGPRRVPGARLSPPSAAYRPVEIDDPTPVHRMSRAGDQRPARRVVAIGLTERVNAERAGVRPVDFQPGATSNT